MIKGYELYELIAKGNILQNIKIIDARNKIWKFDGAEFVKETGDSDVYSDLEFATMDFEIIEDEEEINIQSIEELAGNPDIRINSKEISAEDYFYTITNIIMSINELKNKQNESLKAVKQLDKNIKELR